jgi:hypothetical protein
MKRLFLAVFLTVIIVPPVHAQSTLALQEKCVEGSKKFVLETGGCDQIKSQDGYLHSCQYRCHYNKKLDKCFIRWDMHTFWDKGRNIEEPLRGTHTIHIDLADVFERRLVGQYDDSIIFGECKVGDRKCNSLEQFEALIKPYMEE